MKLKTKLIRGPMVKHILKDTVKGMFMLSMTPTKIKKMRRKKKTAAARPISMK